MRCWVMTLLFKRCGCPLAATLLLAFTRTAFAKPRVLSFTGRNSLRFFLRKRPHIDKSELPLPQLHLLHFTRCKRTLHCFLGFWLFAERKPCFICCFLTTLAHHKEVAPMALTLLNCSICPKHPTFSDTSHLLTHVSSKGHLSHLHKLQVRSHQEISAGNQLATYDQWYQNRDLGRLLSERMLQKEAKRSTKRRRPTLSPRKPQQAQARGFLDIASANRPLPIDPGLQRMTAVKGAASKSLRVGSHLRLDDGSDFDSSPVKKYT